MVTIAVVNGAVKGSTVSTMTRAASGVDLIRSGCMVFPFPDGSPGPFGRRTQSPCYSERTTNPSVELETRNANRTSAISGCYLKNGLAGHVWLVVDAPQRDQMKYGKQRDKECWNQTQRERTHRLRRDFCCENAQRAGGSEYAQGDGHHQVEQSQHVPQDKGPFRKILVNRDGPSDQRRRYADRKVTPSGRKSKHSRQYASLIEDHERNAADPPGLRQRQQAEIRSEYELSEYWRSLTPNRKGDNRQNCS